MRRTTAIALVCLAAIFAQAELIDRVVATVNGRPVLESDVDETVRYEALVEGKPLDRINGSDVQSTIDRLIDQELLRQQMGTMAPELSRQDIEAKVDEIRKQHSASAEQWQQRLTAYGINEQIFATRLENQLRTMAFLENRLRPSIVIDRPAVETYYRDTFLPQLRKAGATQDPPLTDVQPQIREILTQQRIDEMLVTWLHNLRQQSALRIIQTEPQARAATASETAK